MSKIVKDITELFGRRRKKRSVTNKFPKNGQNIKTDPKSDLIDISFGPISIRNLGEQSKAGFKTNWFFWFFLQTKKTKPIKLVFLPELVFLVFLKIVNNKTVYHRYH